MSTMASPKSRHDLALVPKLVDSSEVKRRPDIIDAPSRVIHWIVAANGVAPSRPTPTPSRIA
jgi:hypothetical protein